jgi:hypothetical protein
VKPEAKVGKATIRVRETKTCFAGIVLFDGKIVSRLEDQDPERLWERLHQEAARTNSTFVGYAGAKARFLRMFPDGFASKAYLEDGNLGERNYKLRAKRRLDEAVPLEQARDARGAGEAILRIYQATNLVFPNEKNAPC